MFPLYIRQNGWVGQSSRLMLLLADIKNAEVEVAGLVAWTDE